MIKKSLLPVGVDLPASIQHFSHDSFQRLHPACQPDASFGKCDEQVQMIGHHDIPANRDVMLVKGSITKSDECFMNRLIVQNTAPASGVEGYKIKWADVLEEFDPGRTSRMSAVHC